MQGGSDEVGMAILEIIHELAPGATLGIASGFNGDAQADSIQSSFLPTFPVKCSI